MIESYLEAIALTQRLRATISARPVKPRRRGRAISTISGTVLAQEVQQRGNQLARQLQQADFEKPVWRFDFGPAVRTLQQARVMELVHGGYIGRHENLHAGRPSG